MRIQSFAIQAFRAPLKLRFAQANQSTQRADALILQLNTQAGSIGYGEACPRTYVTGEDTQSVTDEIHQWMPRFCQYSFSSFEEIQAFIFQQAALQLRPAALCLLELALLDAWGQETGQNIGQCLGLPQTPKVHYSGIVPLDDPQKIARIIPLLQSFAFKELKLKLNHRLEDCLDTIQLIRKHWGEEIPIRVDANTGWTYEQALLLIPHLIEQGVSVIEQPLPPQQDPQMVQLCRQFGERVKLMADESLTTLSSGQRLVEQGAFNHFNLKVSKNGGILSTIRLYRFLEAKGYTCQLGAHFGETCILTAAGIWVAAAAPGLLAQEGGLGTWLLEHDLCEDSLRIDRDAKIALSQLKGSGLGLNLSAERLALI